MNPFDIMVVQLHNLSAAKFDNYDTSYLPKIATNRLYVTGVLVHKMGVGIMDDDGEE